MALEDIESAIDDFKDQLFLLQSGYDEKENLQEAYGSFNTLIVFLPQLKNTNEYSRVKEAFKSLLSVKGRILKGKNLKKLNEYGSALVAKAIQEYRKIEEKFPKKEERKEEKEVEVSLFPPNIFFEIREKAEELKSMVGDFFTPYKLVKQKREALIDLLTEEKLHKQSFYTSLIETRVRVDSYVPEEKSLAEENFTEYRKFYQSALSDLIFFLDNLFEKIKSRSLK